MCRIRSTADRLPMTTPREHLVRETCRTATGEAVISSNRYEVSAKDVCGDSRVRVLGLGSRETDRAGHSLFLSLARCLALSPPLTLPISFSPSLPVTSEWCTVRVMVSIQAVQPRDPKHETPTAWKGGSHSFPHQYSGSRVQGLRILSLEPPS